MNNLDSRRERVDRNARRASRPTRSPSATPREGGDWRSNVYSIPSVGGDGGAFATADDLVRFAQAVEQGRLVSAETTAAMLSEAEAPARGGRLGA